MNAQSPSVTGAGGSMDLAQLESVRAEYKKNPNPANAEKYKEAVQAYKKANS